MIRKYTPEIRSKPNPDWDVNIINVKIITDLRVLRPALESAALLGDFMGNNIYTDFKHSATKQGYNAQKLLERYGSR